MKKMQINIKTASIVIDRIHEDDLPITIHTGEKVDVDRINVLVECDNEELFDDLLDEVNNNDLI